MEDQGKVWDRILAESMRTSGSTPSEARTTASALRLDPKPQARHLLTVPRKAALVPPPLREAFGALTRAKAPWPLFVAGPPGTGKTCAALVLLDHAGGEYHTAAGLCEALIRSAAGRLEWSHLGRGGTLWPEQFWKQLAAAPLVVLDELGARDRVSDHHYEAVKRVLDERHGRPLVLLSNLDLAALERLYDDRLASRMAAGTVVRLDGPDRRIERR